MKHSAVGDFFRKLFDTRSSGYLHRYLRALLFWNPLLTFPAQWIFPTTGLSAMALWGELWILTAIVSTLCYGSVSFFTWGEATVRRLRNLSPSRHSRFLYLFVFWAPIPFALYIGATVPPRVFGSLGWSWIHPNTVPLANVGLLAIMMSVMSFLVKNLSDWREEARAAELKARKLENDRLQAQLSALAAQINPHFLFNAMNTVASLIPTDPFRAEDTLVRLSHLYRSVLAAAKRTTHPLATELDLCRTYLEIEQVRFGDRLSFAIEIETGLNIDLLLVPVLTLQPIVENAIKHGLSSRASKGQVAIRIQRVPGAVEVRVEDDGVGLGNSRAAGTGTGITNCRERLHLTYGDSGSVEIRSRPEGGTIVTVLFPIAVELKNLAHAH